VNRLVADQTVTWNEEINVSLLRSYFKSAAGSTQFTCGSPDDYWPGIILDQFAAKHQAGLSVFATVGNGADTSRIQVLDATENGSSFCQVSTTQMHLYSNLPMKKEVRWSIYRGDALLSAYTETPAMVVMPDGMQHARVIGGSPHLVPLAQQMPSSLASTLGFIDEKYSLVALEEDALAPNIARRYERSGVPALGRADIFPAADERVDVPVVEWLKVNPPESLAERVCGYSYALEDGVRVITLATALNAGVDMIVVKAPLMELAPARIAPPQAMTVFAQDPEAYLDYESALAAEAVDPARIAKSKRAGVQVSNGCLVIDLGGFTPSQRQRMTLVLCDLSGRAVWSWSVGQAESRSRLLVPVGRNGVSPGTYVMHVNSDFARQVLRVVVR
jgi:hypothetical protein